MCIPRKPGQSPEENLGNKHGPTGMLPGGHQGRQFRFPLKEVGGHRGSTTVSSFFKG